MPHILLLAVVLAVCISAGSGIAAEPEEPRMTWEQIEQGLLQHPPAYENTHARARIFAAIDANITDKLTTHEPDLVAFYRRQVDRALDGLERTPVTEGVRVWKLYSSSVILKSPDGVAMLDFCQGPIHNGGLPEDMREADTQFYFTPEQRGRLAGIVDVMMMTHRHHDHADYALASLLIEQGKPVIGPAEMKEWWHRAPFAAEITVPTYETAQTFGPCEIFTGHGAQYSPLPGQKPEEVDRTEPKRQAEHAIYMVHMAGITFLHAGDNWDPLDGWLKRARTAGWVPEVVFADGMHDSGRSVRATYPDLFRIPVHDHEMKHTGGGNKLAPWFNDRSVFERKRRMVLMWGESFLVTRQLLSQRSGE